MQYTGINNLIWICLMVGCCLTTAFGVAVTIYDTSSMPISVPTNNPKAINIRRRIVRWRIAYMVVWFPAFVAVFLYNSHQDSQAILIGANFLFVPQYLIGFMDSFCYTQFVNRSEWNRMSELFSFIMCPFRGNKPQASPSRQTIPTSLFMRINDFFVKPSSAAVPDENTQEDSQNVCMDGWVGLTDGLMYIRVHVSNIDFFVCWTFAGRGFGSVGSLH